MIEKSGEILHAVGKLEGKVETFMQVQTQHFDRMNRIDTNIEGLESRVRTVEKKQYGLFFAATAIWGIIQTAFGFMKH